MLSYEQLLAMQTLVGRVRPPDLLADLHSHQRAFILDPAKRKTARCGRRSGKTEGDGRYLCKVARDHDHYESYCLYVALTRPTAKKQMWGRIKYLSHRYQLNAQFNNQDLTATLPGGAQIWLTGASDSSDIEKLRGYPFRLVILDEAASFGPFFEEMVEQIIEPGLEDYDGTLCMTGTPGAACVGLFHNATTGALKTEDGKPQYSNHHWTILDNPCFPRWSTRKGRLGPRIPFENWEQLAHAWLENLRRTKGWSPDNPIYRREWLGQWVRFLESLVYRYDPARNGFLDLPEGHTWRHVLGMDLGYDDLTAWVVWAFCYDLPFVYCVHQEGDAGLTVAEVARRTRAVQERFKPVSTVADTGGLGKMVVAEMVKRYGLNIKPAEKSEKREFIELYNADLHEGYPKVRRDSPMAYEYERLQWDEDGLKEDPRFPNHYSDAGLYGWREAKHWLWRAQERRIITPDEEMEMYRRSLVEAADAQKPWWRD